MDEKILERLRRHITSDLGGFLPRGCFKLEGKATINDSELSRAKKWECMAAYLGNKLCYESERNDITLTPREALNN